VYEKKAYFHRVAFYDLAGITILKCVWKKAYLHRVAFYDLAGNANTKILLLFTII